jgi:hypothetical protein
MKRMTTILCLYTDNSADGRKHALSDLHHVRTCDLHIWNHSSNAF